jgi:hypothetical protein
MLIFTPSHLADYLAHDRILGMVNAASEPRDSEFFVTHRWLLESQPKRMIYDHVYGDLFAEDVRVKTILDVGGGFTALTRILVRRHIYKTLDLMAHDSALAARQQELALKKDFFIHNDWYEFQPSTAYDMIIANDLFPNVDQRLEIFLNQYLPYCREMRLTLTFYNTMRWYKVNRADANEVFHMLAWDGAQLTRILNKFSGRFAEPLPDLSLHDAPSLYANQRQICYVTLRGDL